MSVSPKPLPTFTGVSTEELFPSIAAYSPATIGMPASAVAGTTGAVPTTVPTVAPTMAPVVQPQTGLGGVLGGSGASTPFGFNLGTAGLALGGAQTLAGIFSAMQAQELAEDQFNYQKRVTGANMANQVQSYNTNLAGIVRARAMGEDGHNGGMTMADVKPYLQRNKLANPVLG